MSQYKSQTNSGYVNSIQTTTNVVTNATGISDIEVIGLNLANVQKMVNFDTKSIFTNIIGKFDKSPIQVIDPINLSNSFFVGGTAYSATGSSGSGSGTSIVAGLTNIGVFSNASTAAAVIKFVTNSTIAATFDGYGNFLYSPGPSTGTFEISGNLVTKIFSLSTSSNVSSMYLRADSTGNASWHPLDTLGNSNVRLLAVSNGVSAWQQGFQFSQLNSNLGIVSTLGFIDKNGIWSIGSPDYILNTDLKSSNNVLVVSNIRFKEASNQQVGSFLRVANIYGDLEYVEAGTINTYITNQIVADNNQTSVLANLTNISFAVGGGEVARINSNGFLGLGNPLPQATLDNSNASILRSTVQLTNLYPGYPAQTGFVLTTIDSAGTAAWQNISSITDSLGNSISIGNAGAPVALVVNSQRVFVATTTSNLIATGGQQTMTMDISGVVIAQQYRGTDDTINFTTSAGTNLAVITSAGNVGIGTTTPGNTLTVAGSVGIDTSLTVGNSITGNQQIVAGAGFSGDGSQITNINPTNVGSGANNLTFFYSDTRANLALQSTQTSQNLSTILGIEGSNLLLLSSLVSTVAISNYSTLSTQTYGIWLTLSTTAGVNLSTLYSTIYGVSNGLSTIQGDNFSTLSTGSAGLFSTLSSFIYSQGSTLSGNTTTNSNYFSSFISTVYSSNLANISTSVGGLSTLIGPGYYAVSTATYNYINQQISSVTSVTAIVQDVKEQIQSTFTFNQLNVGVGLPAQNLLSTNYTLDISGSALFHNGPVYLSTIVGVQYPYGAELTGALDVNGYAYAHGFASKGPLGPQFYRTGSTLGGFAADNRLVIGQSSLSYFGTGIDISGNINLTGNLYINDNEVELSPTWNKYGSNVTYTQGNVGIGTTAPQNSLDVAGIIRCQGLQIVSFVDPGSGGGNSGDISLINIRTSTLAVSTINSFPAFPARSGWSDMLLQSSLTTTAKVVCSTTVTLNASSFLMATANHNMVNTTGSQRVGYTYLTVNGYPSRSTMITLAPSAGASVSLAHRIYEGPGTWLIAAWAYADAGTGSVLGIRADVSGTGNMF